MLDNQKDLSPDLEWMLQSGLVKEEILAEHLARKYYARVLTLCSDRLTYPEEASRAATETFDTAASSARNFSGEMTVWDWLADLADGICRTRRAQLDEHQFLNPYLIRAILRESPPRPISPRAIEKSVSEIGTLVGAKRTGRLKKSGVQEMALVAVAVVFLLGILQMSSASFNTPAIEPTPPAMAFPIQADGPIEEIPTSPEEIFEISSGNTERGFPPQAPLSRASSHEDIWRRLLLSRYLWETLWADVWLVLHGPEGYNGPPLVERHQLWIEQDNRAIHLSGPPGGGPSAAERIDELAFGPAPYGFLYGVDDYARLGSQLPWFFLSQDILRVSPYLINFYYTGQFNFPPTDIRYEVLGEDHWIGRRTVVVQSIDSDGEQLERLWLDNRTGIVLRAQYFIPGSPGGAVLEAGLIRLRLDQEFPEEIFNKDERTLLEDGFTIDFTAVAEPDEYRPAIPLSWALFTDSARLPRSIPPEDIDLAGSRLTFQPIESWLGFYAEDMPLQVYADEYYRRQIQIHDLFKTTCERSPDGNMIAYAQWIDTQVPSPGLIRLLNLSSGKLIDNRLPGMLFFRFAFSPDSRHLAVAGIDARDGKGGLSIIDTVTGDKTDMNEVDQMWSLAWSPDGDQLAALKWSGVGMETGNSLLVRVFDLSSGKAVNFRPSEYQGGRSIFEVSLGEWTARFLLPMLGIENCVDPPQAAAP